MSKCAVKTFLHCKSTHYLKADMLVRYPCLREDDLCDLLKFDKKVLRAKLQTLKTDRFVQAGTGETVLQTILPESRTMSRARF